MTVTRLNDLAADTRKVQAAQRTALVTKLVASKRTRASKIASLDGEVNSIFAQFKEANTKFTRASLLKTVAKLEAIRSSLATDRRNALKDMSSTIAAGIPNKGVIAQYEDLSALSAKIAALIVTAKVSLAEDSPIDDQMDDHDIVTIDSNGYVSEDNFEVADDDSLEPVNDEIPTEDDLSVASEDGDEDDLYGDSDPEVEVAKAALAYAKAKAKAKRASDESLVETPVTNPDTVAKAKRADNSTDPNDQYGTTDDPYLDSVDDLRAADPVVDPILTTAKAKAKAKRANDDADVDDLVEDSDPEVEVAKAALAYAKAKAKAKRSSIVDDAEQTQEYPEDAELVDAPEDAVIAAGEEFEDYPEEPDLVETPEEAVFAADDDALDFLDSEDETDDENLSLADQLDLPDSGIDEALQAEILDDDQLDAYDLEDDEEVTASVQARGGKAAQRERKLASATRTNPRATDDVVLKSLVTELML